MTDDQLRFENGLNPRSRRRSKRGPLAQVRGRLSTLPWKSIAFVGAYAVLALAANWPAWPGDPDRIRTVSNYGAVGTTDLEAGTWFIGWTAHALAHGLNPFYTNSLNYPDGINLAQNTSAPLLGLLTAPLTLLVNPIASVNLLLWLAFWLSAGSMFFVLRRFVKWEVAAFIGGALYGFSPYLVDESLYHLNLCFVPLPPVILLCFCELFRAEQQRPLRWGVGLGLSVVGQFFISPEVCATTIVMAVVGVVVLCIASPGKVRIAIRGTKSGLLAASYIVLLSLLYPIGMIYLGPYRFIGTPNPGGEGADLLNPFLPTSLERLSFGHFGVIGSNLVFGNTSENGGYLGIPLLLLMLMILVRYWRKPWVRFSALMGLVAFVLSLGNHLDIDNHRTTFPLPFDLVANRPVFNEILQVRLGLYVALFASFLVSLGIDEFHSRATRRVQRTAAPRPCVSESRGVVTVGRAAVLLLAAFCAATLVPALPLATTASDVPAYFASSAVDAIPAGSVVLISPYPSVFDPVPEMWQAVAGYRFKIIGGYGLFSSGPSGGFYPTPYPPSLQPVDVEMYLTGEADGAPFLSGPIPQLNAKLECDVRLFLVDNDVRTVLTGPIPTSFNSDQGAIKRLYLSTIGRPSVEDGAVTAWYDVARRIGRSSSSFTCGTG